MHCKTCDYRLWGIKGRECPECGSPFLPSEFEFVPNSVRFCCPDCGQDYYGTGEKGHLVPSGFECVRCGRALRMDDMVLFTTEGVREEQTYVQQMPWLDKKGAGFFRRWLRTIWMSMFSPTRLMELTPRDSSVGQALWFAVLTSGIAFLGFILPFMILPMMAVLSGPRHRIAILGGMEILGFLSYPVGLLVFLLIWGGVVQIVLSVTGPCGAGFKRTYQAICYGSAANIAGIVPCFGLHLLPVAWIWWSVSAILMLRKGQNVSTFRAILATLFLPFMLVLTGVCLVMYVAIPAFQSAQIASTLAVQRGNLKSLASSISLYAGTHGGRAPIHASELITSASISGYTFVNSDVRALAEVPLANTDLKQFSGMSISSQNAVVQAAGGALPVDVVAHRFGDFVFTYHGIDFNKADPGLWVVILAPEDPVKNTGPVQIGLADGTTTSIPRDDFAKALTAQNALRRSQGLAPLFAPREVTHEKPAASTQPVSATSSVSRT